MLPASATITLSLLLTSCSRRCGALHYRYHSAHHHLLYCPRRPAHNNRRQRLPPAIRLVPWDSSRAAPHACRILSPSLSPFAATCLPRLYLTAAKHYGILTHRSTAAHTLFCRSTPTHTTPLPAHAYHHRTWAPHTLAWWVGATHHALLLLTRLTCAAARLSTSHLPPYRLPMDHPAITHTCRCTVPPLCCPPRTCTHTPRHFHTPARLLPRLPACTHTWTYCFCTCAPCLRACTPPRTACCLPHTHLTPTPYHHACCLGLPWPSAVSGLHLAT